MRDIEVDPDASEARASRPGCWSLEVGKAGERSWALRGCPGYYPDVGVVGFSLGGGLSWLGRRLGFACNRISAIELVTAHGEASHGRRRQPPRSVLGPARRRGRLRDRHRPPCPPAADRRDLRRARCCSRPRSAPRRSGPTGTGRRFGLRRRHVLWSASSPRRPSPTCPSPASRHAAADHRRRLHLHPRLRAKRHPRPPSRDRGADHGHPREWMPSVSLSHIHMDPE